MKGQYYIYYEYALEKLQYKFVLLALSFVMHLFISSVVVTKSENISYLHTVGVILDIFYIKYRAMLISFV